MLTRHNVPAIDEVIAHVKESHEQDQRIQVSPTDLAAELRSDGAPKLIDVRPPEEQDVVRIDGALPATQGLVQEMMNTWSKDTPIVCYCHHGLQSLDAASYFIGHGFTNVRSLAGGVHGWAQEVDTSLPRY